MRGHIKFKRDYEKGSKDDSDPVYTIYNNQHDDLGYISYSDTWKTWIFNAGIACYFDALCLQEIINRIKELNNDKKIN